MAVNRRTMAPIVLAATAMPAAAPQQRRGAPAAPAAGSPTSGRPTQATLWVNEALRRIMPFGDERGFEDARRGFVAALPDPVVIRSGGGVQQRHAGREHGGTAGSYRAAAGGWQRVKGGRVHRTDRHLRVLVPHRHTARLREAASGDWLAIRGVAREARLQEKGGQKHVKKNPCPGVLLLLVLAFLVLGSASSEAQLRYLAPAYGSSMTNEDFQIQRSTAVNLLNSGQVGNSREWSNPRSGAQGEVSLLSDLQERGMPCRQMRYAFVTRGAARQTEAVLKACRSADGIWKILD